MNRSVVENVTNS